MKKELGRKFWAAMLIFGLVGQIAWVVENMYLNVFLYKMFHASAADISLMVGASSVAATVTTLLVGALSDKLGKRKLIICLGYIVWGFSILGFAFIRVDVLTPIVGSTVAAATLGIQLTIVLDCIMTFFGSAANDACYNAWLTDRGEEGNRGKIEGFNSMMPLVSILVVFGGFMGFNLDLAKSWTTIFIIIGGVVLAIGILGFFLIEESPLSVNKESESYLQIVTYSFRPSVMRENKLLYAVLFAFAVFGISIQTYMPYLILYYEQGLEMSNYVLIMAPAIILAAIVTAFYGKLYDMQGFKGSIILSLSILLGGYVLLYFSKTTVPVFIGSLLMMIGYMTGMLVFGAMIRDRIPENKAGQFQGIRIIGQVLLPGIIGPVIGAFVLRNAEQILNSDGTYSFLPNRNIFAAAFIVGVVLGAVLYLIFTMMRTGHYELMSEAGEDFLRENKLPWMEYPRPQMRRAQYQILNGTWTVNGEQIQVPFPPQSILSGYKGKVKDVLLYETKFVVSSDFAKERVLLHFGAVDQIAKVLVNREVVGTHEGGYLPFTCDITEALKDGENYLRVEVMDTLSKKYPYGKQTKKRGGMWYTPVSGIWQTVWMECVPKNYIEKIRLTPDLEGVDIEVKLKDSTIEDRDVPIKILLTLHNGQIIEQSFHTTSARIDLSNIRTKDGNLYVPKLWTPDEPYLYSMQIFAGEDSVETYFALRTISIEETPLGKRVCLNGKPIFLHGVLDQGYFCDGIFLPAKAEEYEKDIMRMKELGINMLRKHIKVEPENFYYACDRLGMFVMQDMVNSGPYSFIFDTALPTIGLKKRPDTLPWEKKTFDSKDVLGKENAVRNKRKAFFIRHSKDTIEHLYNHPSIIAYTIFNEGWGQFNSDEVYDLVKQWDSTRLVDSTSGWFWQGKNDFDSEHIYFKVIPLQVKDRPLFVSECGGYTMAVKGHCYSKYASYGYGACENEEALTGEILYMYENMIEPFIGDGLCGCVYTQLSDVEDEVNGLYTYDRKVCKVDKTRMQKMADRMLRKVNCADERRN